MDIGGGSTELITGSAAGELHSAISLDVGSVRVTERFLKQNPVADDDLERATTYVDELLAGSGVDFDSIGTWIGVAGTATTLAGVYLELEHYDRERVHGTAIPLPALEELLHRLARMTVDEIRALPSMHRSWRSTPASPPLPSPATPASRRCECRTPRSPCHPR